MSISALHRGEVMAMKMDEAAKRRTSLAATFWKQADLF